MEFHILLLLVSFFICLSKSQEIIYPTNYTLSFFKNVNMTEAKCHSDNDCPDYSKCENSHGRFGDFLCPELKENMSTHLEEKDIFCFKVNTELWDLEKEEFYDYVKVRPIIKTCPSRFGSCQTEACTFDSECLSGACLNHKCVNENMNSNFYQCSPGETNMECGKVNGMECEDDSECLYTGCFHEGRSSSKYCVENTASVKTILIYFGCVVAFLILYGLIASYIYYKHPE